MRSLINQVVTACTDYKYQLDKNGNTTWTWAWSLPSGFLFTMTTLATIGFVLVNEKHIAQKFMLILFNEAKIG